MHTHQGAGTAPVSKTAVVGEEGFFLLRYMGEPLAEALQGDYTGAIYRFDMYRKLYVDKRDAVFLLGPDFEVI